MSYCGASDIKSYVGITDSGDDALITALASRAQALIDEYTRRTFEAAADTTRYFDAERDVDELRRTLYLDHDLCAVTTVVNGDSTTISASDYALEPRNRTPYYALTLKQNAASRWTYDDTPEDAIAITGRWAYSTTAPADIVHACVRLAAFLYKQKDNQTLAPETAVVSMSGALHMPAKLPNDVRDILYNYRRLVP